MRGKRQGPQVPYGKILPGDVVLRPIECTSETEIGTVLAINDSFADVELMRDYDLEPVVVVRVSIRGLQRINPGRRGESLPAISNNREPKTAV